MCEAVAVVDSHWGVWLDQKIPINAKTIHAITGLPQEGEDATDAFSAKVKASKDGATTEE